MTAGVWSRHGLMTRQWGSAGTFSETPLPSYLWTTSVFSPVPPALAGSRPNGHRNPTPRVAPRSELRQMQHEATHRSLDPDGQLQQPLPQGGHLRGRTDSDPGCQ